jgi:hypothetical protein
MVCSSHPASIEKKRPGDPVRVVDGELIIQYVPPLQHQNKTNKIIEEFKHEFRTNAYKCHHLVVVPKKKKKKSILNPLRKLPQLRGHIQRIETTNLELRGAGRTLH